MIHNSTPLFSLLTFSHLIIKAHCQVWDNWKSFKNYENAFYITLNALFVLKIFKFLSWLFGHVEKRLKMARMVNLRLAFTEWVFYSLVILIKLCKIWYLNLYKALLLTRNQVICLKNWKLWRAPTTIKFNIFCWILAHVYYLTTSTKGCSGCLDLKFLSKM